jgi:hypothetical protein
MRHCGEATYREGRARDLGYPFLGVWFILRILLSHRVERIIYRHLTLVIDYPLLPDVPATSLLGQQTQPLMHGL